jgi:hypothetical protein
MAGNTLTDIQIFNNALLRLGESSDNFVTAVDGSDTSKYGVIAGYEYYRTRDEELRAHKWLFAVKRQALSLAYLNSTGTWSSSATTMTLAGVTIVTFTAATASALVLAAGYDLPCRTLTVAGSVVPNLSWIGQNISGPGISADTVVRGINYLSNTIQLSRPVTSYSAAGTFYIVPLRCGWLVTSALAPGNILPTYPTGIPTGTFISAITVSGSTVTLTLSQTTTALGTSVSVCLQAQNYLGYWYMYQKPADSIRDDYIYVLLPDFVYIWPFSVVHQDFFPSKTEGQYIYTDLDPNNGNPYVAYLAEVTDTTLFDHLFVDALIMRLASKMALYATGGDKLKGELEQEYMALVSRAQTYNLMEMDSDIEGNVWWTSRARD